MALWLLSFSLCSEIANARVHGTAHVNVKPPSRDAAASATAKDVIESAPSLAVISQRAQAMRDDAQLATLGDRLRGRAVSGWEGWVAHVNCQGERCDVSFYGEDPYAPLVQPLATPTLDALLGPGTGLERYPYVTATGVAASVAKNLRLGQHLRIAATITDVGYSTGLNVMLNGAQFVPAPPPESPTVSPSDDSAPSAEDDMRITLVRGPCYGRCPTYELTIDGDGTLTFIGDRFVGPEGQGKHTARISAAQRKALVDAFAQADFFALQDRYQRPMISDQPSVTLTYRRGVVRKTIHHSFGDLTAPVKLLLLEDQIDALAGTSRFLP